ncbi:MAG: CDF family Co(II)/Ni(II) efflux transporter DmeF [Deferrisomatales bacterium]|nr:CDF family Co(II)/Ni(II) efflux transporter DmeF [Deferrisomatales bacterium]
MHIYTLDQWQHEHRFHTHNLAAERNTRRVIWLTLFMMVAEIIAGWRYGSMALLADGWHMGTHFFALSITAVAYYYSRKHAEDRTYSFGTGKVDVLGGFTSAVVLVTVAFVLAAESVQRFFVPEQIHFNNALLVATIGLAVNLFSAYLLHGSGHDHGNEHHGEHGHHQDHNLKAAYLHVLADALTSVLAIVALLAGKLMGWVWLDPLMGVIGSLVIAKWAHGLMRDTSSILLDRDQDQVVGEEIRSLIEADADNRVSDLHVWRISANRFAAIVSVVTHHPKGPDHYKTFLAGVDHLGHVSVEVHPCDGESCVPVGDGPQIAAG